MSPLKMEIIDEYISSLIRRNLSIETITNWGYSIKKFMEYNNKEVDQVSSEDINKYIADLYADKSVWARLQQINAINSFFIFCLSKGYAKVMPVKRYMRPKTPKTTPRNIGEHELSQIEIFVEQMSLRDRTIFELLLSSGMRRKELSNIRVSDLDLNNCCVWITVKGNKRVLASFSEEAAFLLSELIKDREDIDSYVFQNKRGRKLSGEGICQIFKDIGIELGLAKPLTPHRLRSTKATKMIYRGASFRDVADQLNQANESTAQLYARVPIEEIVKEYRRIMEV